MNKVRIWLNIEAIGDYIYAADAHQARAAVASRFLSGSAKKADLRIGNLVQILALAADLGKSVLALFPPKAWWLRRRLLTVIFSAELESKRHLTMGEPKEREHTTGG